MDFAILNLTQECTKDVRDIMIPFLHASLKAASYGLAGGKISTTDAFFERIQLIFDLVVNDKLLLLYFNRQQVKSQLDENSITSDGVAYFQLAVALIHHCECLRFSSKASSVTAYSTHRKKKQRADFSPWGILLRNAFGFDADQSCHSTIEKSHWLYLLWIMIRKYPHALPLGPRSFVIKSIIIRLSRITMVCKNFSSLEMQFSLILIFVIL